jgi:hypothetical protein
MLVRSCLLLRHRIFVFAVPPIGDSLIVDDEVRFR